jgi:ATP-dependent Clp protease adapter protein ClpS
MYREISQSLFARRKLSTHLKEYFMLMSVSNSFATNVIGTIFLLLVAVIFVLGIVGFVFLIVGLFQRVINGSRRIFPQKIFNGDEISAIILIDDNVNSLESVVNTLMITLGIPERQSINLMMRVHQEGIAIVWAGTRSKSEEYLQIMQRDGLKCFSVQIPPNT